MSVTPPPPDSLPIALDRYLDHLRVERALMPATLESYARDLREYLEWLESQGILHISGVGRLHVLAHLSALHARGLSRASQARHLAAVRGLHRAQIRAALEQVGREAVPQRVRVDVR